MHTEETAFESTEGGVEGGGRTTVGMKQPRRVLIVEDEDVVASDISESLEHFGYRIVGRATRGEDAVSLARQHRPDLVLMDIKLKGEMDGISAAALIRESIDIPVIYLTAYADDETIERAKITEPYGYVLKPFKELELRTAIELALHRSGRAVGERAEELTAEDEDLSPQAAEAADILRRIEYFRTVDDATLRIAARGCKLETFQANDLIVFEGDAPTSGLVVVRGRVAMVKTSANGKELIVELLPPGDPFGLFATIDKQPYSFTLRAQVDSTVLWVPQTKVMMVLDNYPEVSRRLIREVFERLRNAHDLSRALAHDLVEVRVASALCALIPRFCSVDNADEEIYTIEMTRQELAEMIGSTSETVIRATKAMERSGLLDLTKSGTIRILDKEGLEELVES